MMKLLIFVFVWAQSTFAAYDFRRTFVLENKKMDTVLNVYCVNDKKETYCATQTLSVRKANGTCDFYAHDWDTESKQLSDTFEVSFNPIEKSFSIFRQKRFPKPHKVIEAIYNENKVKMFQPDGNHYTMDLKKKKIKLKCENISLRGDKGPLPEQYSK